MLMLKYVKRFFTDFIYLPNYLFFRRYFLLPVIIFFLSIGIFLFAQLIINRRSNLGTIKGHLVFWEVKRYNKSKSNEYKLILTLYHNSKDYYLFIKGREVNYFLNKLRFQDKIEIKISKHIYKELILQLKVNDKILTDAEENEKNIVNVLFIILLFLIVFITMYYFHIKSMKKMIKENKAILL